LLGWPRRSSEGGDLTQRDQAREFRARHGGGEIVVLPNAFDVASARVIAKHQPVAIGTTSAGIAWALGFPDGQRIDRDAMLSATERIVRSVPVGVTADVEAGYGDAPEDAAATAEAVIEIGAIGLNIEDAAGDSEEPLLPIDRAAEKIAAVRGVAESAGIELVVNARTDAFLYGVDDALEVAVERGNRYLAAGADCVFVPGAVDRDAIGQLVDRLDGPLNVYAIPGVPEVGELSRLGVARVSVGCGPYQACMALVDEATRALLGEGSYDPFLDRHLSVPELQTLLA
jgi:2-methylisocitrate lyase-like PEP mutase family enzyme